VVDDDPDTRGAMGEVLHHGGYEVAMAANGKEALRVLANMDPPCLILLDLSMPTMGGTDFLERLRANAAHSSVPVVVITAEPGPAPPGAAAVLRKPARVEALQSAVETFRSRG
jgi:CheY-like chemotaxis protein